MTNEDIALCNLLNDKITHFKNNLQEPYVWRLKICEREFKSLENAIVASVNSHNGSYDHLYDAQFVFHIVVYCGEWYRRCYTGAEDYSEIIKALEAKKIWGNAGLKKDYLYDLSSTVNAYTGYQYSLFMLGGMAIQLKSNSALLQLICKMFKEESLDTFDWDDSSEGSKAFRKSIDKKHSIYYFLSACFQGNNPFAIEDLESANSTEQDFINKLLLAEKETRKNKFRTEWLFDVISKVSFKRRLKISLEPEDVGGRYKTYINMERLAVWIGNLTKYPQFIKFCLSYKNQSNEHTKRDLFNAIYSGNPDVGYEITGEGSTEKTIEIPLDLSSDVAIDLYVPGNRSRCIQTISVPDCMQVYFKPYCRWTEKVDNQARTAVIYNEKYKVKEEQKKHFVDKLACPNTGEFSPKFFKCGIYDMLTLVNVKTGEEVHFFNRSGRFQVVPRQKPDIMYENDNCIECRYQSKKASYEPKTIQDDIPNLDGYDYEYLPLITSLDDLEVRYFSDKDKMSLKYDVVEREKIKVVYSGKDWFENIPEKTGPLNLTFLLDDKDVQIKKKVFYLKLEQNEVLMYRDLNQQAIAFPFFSDNAVFPDKYKNNNGSLDSNNVFKSFRIGSDNAFIVLKVYHPWNIKEVYQNNSCIEACTSDIQIPFILKDQFVIRQYNEKGVSEYSLKDRPESYYDFMIYLDDVQNNQVNWTPFAPIPEINCTLYLGNQQAGSNNLYTWHYNDDIHQSTAGETLNGTPGIIFQSLKDNASPRHYCAPEIRDVSLFSSITNEKDPLTCFEMISEHKVYFPFFAPMREATRSDLREDTIKRIVLPLLRRRDFVFSDEDCKNLHRYALEFHFDWMLVPREDWVSAINDFTQDEGELDRIKAAISSLFLRTPKCTSNSEKSNLKQFVESYWTFQGCASTDSIAKIAINCILGRINYDSFGSIENFLKAYDSYKYKFIEMSKVFEG